MLYNSDSMKIIFAQGNPESRFDGTRHNVGFFLIDQFAHTLDARWTNKSKFHAHITELTVNGEKIVLVKPTTFYNDTGDCARILIDFYKIDPARDLLVIHDDLALPFGTIRTRKQGSDAGNNGIKSINMAVGEHYARIRFGIWNELRDRMSDVDFVLGHFSKDEHAKLKDISLTINELVHQFLNGDMPDHSIKL
jgi:PTH1 family peptidyl-tRNA hydrolase